MKHTEFAAAAVLAMIAAAPAWGQAPSPAPSTAPAAAAPAAAAPAPAMAPMPGMSGGMMHEGMGGMAGRDGMAGHGGMKMHKGHGCGMQGSGPMSAAMAQMHHDMAAVHETGDTDQDFATMMIPHHQGAVLMAQAELKSGKDPEMRALAESIIAAQNKEIAQMKAWVAAHPGKK